MLLPGEWPLVCEVDGVVVPVQARWTVPRAGEIAIGRDDGAGSLDGATEVGRIERTAEHRFVHLAELREGEGLSEERVRDPAVLHLGAQSPERVLHDQVVVEGQRR